MEHKGHYYELFADVLYEAGFYVCVVNPPRIKEYGSNSLRKVKNDKAEAIQIAHYALDNGRACGIMPPWIPFVMTKKP